MPQYLTTRTLILCIGISLLIPLGACQEPPEKGDLPQHLIEQQADLQFTVPEVKPTSLGSLQKFYSDLDYSWQHLDAGVPPFILAQFPEDLSNEVHIKVKKHTFFMGLLPMVLLANKEIFQDRETLLEILERYEHEHILKNHDRARIRELTDRYNLRGDPLRDHRVRSRLLKRVDVIPPSLVLAQAANESAWGTSRFAREGNNLFGQWTFKPGTGIVPEDRPPGATYEVRKFTTLYDSVRSYMNNLNTHGAYLELREIRSTLRRKGSSLTGIALAKGLRHYSIREQEYIDEIDEMIRQNRLGRVNDVPLRIPATDILAVPEPSGAGLFSTRSREGSRLSGAWKNPEM
jgi:Bax protein